MKLARRHASSSAGAQVLLRSRPRPGAAVSLDDFEVAHSSATSDRLQPNELLCQTLMLSVDPFLRCRFNESTGVDYTLPYQIGQPITSAGVGVVLKSGSSVSNVQPGDLVLEPFDSWPWTERCRMPVESVTRIPPALGLLIPPSALLGACGQPGLTALCGIEHHAAPPGPDDVVVVSAAAGAVGSLVGQLAARRGATVIGVCGTDEKAAALARLGFAGAVNYRSPDVGGQLDDLLLRVAGGRRVSLYWDNVGGELSDVIIARMRGGGGITLCGQISMYDTDEEYPPPLPAATAAFAAENAISRDRYLLLNHKQQFPAALAELCRLVASDELVATETVYDEGGVAGAAASFVSMMAGGNFGKAVVRCAPLPPRAAAVDRVRRAMPAALREQICRRFVTPEQFAGLVG